MTMRKLVGIFLCVAPIFGACSEDSSSPANVTPDGGGGDTPDASTEDDGGKPAGTFDCAGAKAGDKLTVMHRWKETEEHARFLAILQPLVDACSIQIEDVPTVDANDLDTKANDGSLDIAIWGSAELVKYDAKLIALDTVNGRKDSYAEFFVSQGTRNGRWTGVPVKADVKTLIWYSPKVFKAKGYTVPTTWEELDALVESATTKGDVPWALGFESGEATGWTGSDFIQDILLVQQGPAFVFDLLSGAVKYDDARVKQAWTTYGKWAKDAKYTVDGANGTLTTSFSNAIFQVFGDAPQALMLKQSGFVQGEVTKKYPAYKYGEDFDFFAIPGAKGIQGGADWLMSFQDKPATRALIGYLTSPKGGASWAKSGLGISPNRGAAGNYTDPVLSKFGETLANTKGFTPDIGDTIPGDFGKAEWKGIVDYVKGDADIDAALASVAQAQTDALK